MEQMKNKTRPNNWLYEATELHCRLLLMHYRPIFSCLPALQDLLGPLRAFMESSGDCWIEIFKRQRRPTNSVKGSEDTTKTDRNMAYILLLSVFIFFKFNWLTLRWEFLQKIFTDALPVAPSRRLPEGRHHFLQRNAQSPSSHAK